LSAKARVADPFCFGLLKIYLIQTGLQLTSASKGSTFYLSYPYPAFKDIRVGQGSRDQSDSSRQKLFEIFDSFLLLQIFVLLQQKIQKQGRNNYWKNLNLACFMVQLQHLFYFGSGSSSSKECRMQIPVLWIWIRIRSGSRRAKMILNHKIKLIHFNL
jgi:hypothetical protein